MLDRTIPYYNMILRCDAVLRPGIPVPPGYRIRHWEPGDEAAWARIESDIGDFRTCAEAERYFAEHYLTQPEALHSRGLFAVSDSGEIAGTCIAWHGQREGRTVASLHWLAVAPERQGLGLGKALCAETLRLFAEMGELPVYLHTQPWSWQAVLIYIRQGFRLLKTDTFDGYENQYEAAMRTLENVLPGALLLELEAASLPGGAG